MSIGEDDARELDTCTTLSPETPGSPSRFKLHGPRANPNTSSRGRAASFQVQTNGAANATIKGKRRHTLVLEPANNRDLPPIPTEVSEGRLASAGELEAAKWRDEVVKLMLTAQGHEEIYEGLERFRQRGMPPLATRRFTYSRHLHVTQRVLLWAVSKGGTAE
ncbi:hypothetical protein BDY19DRAFT_910117 [Irpex rosettiformis]|uniref:Uncharacterized protein n=1 Tax=Irpex rosettiformis TaxID=378272 RepID=A0ACB8TPW0_9APHY|nr:hypothetical protein BDY19DRAFT_910117 [Irpex rosettiformis]